MLAECEQQRRTKEQPGQNAERSEEHTSELQSRLHLVCRLLLEKKKKKTTTIHIVDHTDLHGSGITGCHVAKSRAAGRAGRASISLLHGSRREATVGLHSCAHIC